MKEIAYYPDQELFEGDIEITKPPKGRQDEVGGVMVKVIDNPALTLEILTRTALPIRKEYVAYFTRSSHEPVQCNVDLELAEQPSMATVARAVLYHSTVEVSV